LSARDPEILQAVADDNRILLTVDTDFGALFALSSLTSPSMLLLGSVDHLRFLEQAELIVANLPPLAEDLERGSDRELDERSLARSPASQSQGSAGARRQWRGRTNQFRSTTSGMPVSNQ
jgi:predicted nuclease of predicted toxin-antitoxin system